MKTSSTNLFFFAAAFLAASVAWAADPAGPANPASPGKEVTLVGAGQCAKCSLGITDTCQNALVVTQDGKQQVYLLTQNDLSKKFHDNICQDTKEIKVTGILTETDGRKEITPTSIELVQK